MTQQTAEVQNDELRRLRHELSVASVYAWELRQMISARLQDGHMGDGELAAKVTILDGWLEQWKVNGVLKRT